MAGKYGSQSITVTLEDAPGGTARTITNFILTMGGIKITALTQPSHAFGDSWEEHTPTGMKKGDPITLTGFWDTTADTGPHVVFLSPDDGPQDDGRELVVGYGDSKIMTMDVRLISYAVLGKNGALTEFEAVLQPTGALTWS
jgi:hypothetical protein